MHLQVAHVINYVQRAELVWSTFGAGVWVTGFVLTFILFTLYPATQIDVKRGHFEIFWVTHMLYALLFVMNLIHGKGWIGPNYWKWLIAPGVIYILERIYRECASRKPATLLSVNFMANTFSLAFDKSGPCARGASLLRVVSCPVLSSPVC
jgi:hypothetical protein